MWIRAVWREGDREEEGVIPSHWVSEKFVFWPPGTNAERAVKNKEMPSESWKKFDLIKVKHQSAKRTECERYDYTTTIEETDDEVKRQPKKKKFDDFVTGEVQLPSPPEKIAAKDRRAKSQSPNYHANSQPVPTRKSHSPSFQSQIQRSKSPNQRSRSPSRSNRSSKSKSFSGNLGSISESTLHSKTIQTSSDIAKKHRSRSPNTCTGQTSQSSMSITNSNKSKHTAKQNDRQKELWSPVANSSTHRPHNLETISTQHRPWSQQSDYQLQHNRSPSSSSTHRSKSQNNKNSHTVSPSRSLTSLLQSASRSPSHSSHSSGSDSNISDIFDPPSNRHNPRSYESAYRKYTSTPRSSHRSPSYRPRHSRSRSPLEHSSFSQHQRSPDRSQRFNKSSNSHRQNSSKSFERSNPKSSTLSRNISSSLHSKPEEESGFPMSTARFQKRVLFLLADMRKDIAKIARQKNNTFPETDGEFQLTRAETLEEFMELEESAKKADDRKKMVQKLSAVGGVNLRDNVKRVMEKIMTNEVMSKFNMKGNKGKKSFASTAVFEVVQAGIITKVLDKDISKRISEQQQDAIQSILDHLAKVQEASVASLGEITDARDKATKTIQQEAEQQMKTVRKVVAETDDVLFKDEILWYELSESTPSSPAQSTQHIGELAKALQILHHYKQDWSEDDIVSIIDEITSSPDEWLAENAAHLLILCGEIITSNLLISKAINGRTMELSSLTTSFCVVCVKNNLSLNYVISMIQHILTVIDNVKERQNFFSSVMDMFKELIIDLHEFDDEQSTDMYYMVTALVDFTKVIIRIAFKESLAALQGTHTSLQLLSDK